MVTSLLLLCVLRNAVAFGFRSEPRDLHSSCTTNEGDTGTCVHVLACDEFRSGEQLLRHRPKICHFDGKLPVICCKKRATVIEPLLQCGLRASFIGGLMPRFRRETAPMESDEEQQVHFQVVDGLTATRGSWPWMVALGRPGKQQLLGQRLQLLEWFCGGTLVGRRHVLTAAHCLPTPESRVGLTARLGATDLQLLADPAVQDRQVSRVLLHPRYNAAHNDLALLTLSRPAELTDSVQPVCLPPAGVRHDGRSVLVAGWGLTEFAGTETPDSLQEAPLEVSDVDRCESVYSETIQFDSKFPGGFQGTKLCAEDPRPDGHRDACRGDSGGPLVLEEDGLYQLVGIVSAGIGCGNPSFPGVYTRVSAYIDWIQEAMQI